MLSSVSVGRQRVSVAGMDLLCLRVEATDCEITQPVTASHAKTSRKRAQDAV